MARSSLFRFLKRSIRKTQALQLGESFTRRDFLLGVAVVSGVASSAMALENIARQTKINSLPKVGKKKDEKLIIVGGGLSGLVASYRLLQSGIRTEIYEGSARLGGRIYTKYNFNEEGMFCELGGELIDTGHEEIISLCKELSVPLQDFNETDKNRTTGFYSHGKLRSEREFIVGLQPFLKIMNKDLLAITVKGEMVSPTYRDHVGPGAVALDKMSMAEYLFQKRDQVELWVLDLIEVAYVSEYGLDAGEQSALNLLVLFGSKHIVGEPRVYGDSDECKRVEGGNQRLIGRVAEQLAGHVETHLEHKLVRIKERGRGIELSFDTGSGIKTRVADRVILSLPFTTLRDVEGIYSLPMTKVKKRAIAEMGYGSNYKMSLGFQTPFWRTPQGEMAACNGSLFTDLPTQCYWEMSRMQKGKKGILTAYIGGEGARKLKNDFPNIALNDLAKIYPDVRAQYDGKYLLMAWPHMVFAKGSYSAPRPGQYTTILGSAKEAELRGRLIFAGEHCSLENQGFMNGAVETGNWAAETVLGKRQSALPGVFGVS